MSFSELNFSLMPRRNNKLAKAIRENGVETFEWDDLALIERNGTKYINEPHVGGGNPVLSIGDNTEAIFTDMLGISLGVVNGNNYSHITKTTFGADSNNANSFFTGKPHVKDLGYAFLFRNYRADVGKWLSQDPICYPDGWNNLAYCNNSSTMIIDANGLWAISFNISFSGSSAVSAGILFGIAFAYGDNGFSWGYTYAGTSGLTSTSGLNATVTVNCITTADSVGDLAGFSQAHGDALDISNYRWRSNHDSRIN